MSIPQPEDIYLRTKEEGARRLERPVIEIVSTALAAGFDIVAGIALLGLVAAHLEGWTGVDAAHVFGSIAFGAGFAFLVVGRGELFTENFLVPIAGLERGNRGSYLALARLWIVSPIFNIVGGSVIILILTVHGVLPHGTGEPIGLAARKIHEHHPLSLFMSAVFAGALITAMTWFVEGNDSMLVRIVIAWTAGAMLALGGFNHVIVVTLELIFGNRFGDHIPWLFVLGNFGLAAAGNMVGGIGLVTLNRLTQGKAGHESSGGGASESSA